VSSKVSESEPEYLESLHEGKYYDRTDSKYRTNSDNSWKIPFKKPEPKKCDVCGKIYNGEYKDHKKWHKRWEITPDKKTDKKTDKKPDNNHSILNQLKKVDPKLIEIMDGEKLKELIIKEINGGK